MHRYPTTREAIIVGEGSPHHHEFGGLDDDDDGMGGGRVAASDEDVRRLSSTKSSGRMAASAAGKQQSRKRDFLASLERMPPPLQPQDDVVSTRSLPADIHKHHHHHHIADGLNVVGSSRHRRPNRAGAADGPPASEHEEEEEEDSMAYSTDDSLNSASQMASLLAGIGRHALSSSLSSKKVKKKKKKRAAANEQQDNKNGCGDASSPTASMSASEIALTPREFVRQLVHAFRRDGYGKYRCTCMGLVTICTVVAFICVLVVLHKASHGGSGSSVGGFRPRRVPFVAGATDAGSFQQQQEEDMIRRERALHDAFSRGTKGATAHPNNNSRYSKIRFRRVLRMSTDALAAAAPSSSQAPPLPHGGHDAIQDILGAASAGTGPLSAYFGWSHPEPQAAGIPHLDTLSVVDYNLCCSFRPLPAHSSAQTAVLCSSSNTAGIDDDTQDGEDGTLLPDMDCLIEEDRVYVRMHRQKLLSKLCPAGRSCGSGSVDVQVACTFAWVWIK
jgi:hypothetical protein